MKQTKLFVLTILVIGTLLIMNSRVDATPYAFSMDRFQVVGNLPGDIVDEFDDGVLDPWVVYDPTVVESGGLVSFSSPGTVEGMLRNSFYVLSEMTFIGSGYPSPFVVENGAGDFTGVSRWVPTVPGENQWYEMQVGYELKQEPHEGMDISLGVANWDTVVADFLGIPSGLGISFYRAGDIPIGDWVWQHIPIAESDITGDILLRLNFDDATDQFTAHFSLDGGATFQSPFSPIDWGMETPGHYEWYFSGQSILEVVPFCEGDFDSDGDVDGSDLSIFAADFGRTDCPCAEESSVTSGIDSLKREIQRLKTELAAKNEEIAALKGK